LRRRQPTCISHIIFPGPVRRPSVLGVATTGAPDRHRTRRAPCPPPPFARLSASKRDDRHACSPSGAARRHEQTAKNFSVGGPAQARPDLLRAAPRWPRRTRRPAINPACRRKTSPEPILASVDRQLIRHWAMWVGINATKARAAGLRQSPCPYIKFFWGRGWHEVPRISSRRVPTPCRACSLVKEPGSKHVFAH
jgi:hypothetical protein